MDLLEVHRVNPATRIAELSPAISAGETVKGEKRADLGLAAQIVLDARAEAAERSPTTRRRQSRR